MSGPGKPPFETAALRSGLKTFLDHVFEGRRIGGYRFGCYAFFDYDGEPIYIGQTRESLGTRIRRHLTNQRTDAVAMNVLDPFEVLEIEVWPLPQLEGRDAGEAAKYLDSLESTVFQKALLESKFGAVLNEKEPPEPDFELEGLPASFRDQIVSDQVREIRGHPDIRVARRAATLARLAQVISERKVQPGLRRTLQTQAKRLEWLASERLKDFEPDDPSS